MNTAQAKRAYFITHPNVVISPDVPVPQWPLSQRGLDRMRAGLRQPWVQSLTAVYSSEEQKAMDGAQLLANHLGLSVHCRANLGENDRSSTGFLPPPEFEAMADAFFARSTESVCGWERAVDAQQRIVRAVEQVLAEDTSNGPVAIVSHGAVGTLLWCHLQHEPIHRRWDQPANGGGNYFEFTLEPLGARTHWLAFDEVV